MGGQVRELLTVWLIRAKTPGRGGVAVVMKRLARRLLGRGVRKPLGDAEIVNFLGARILCSPKNKLEAKLLRDPMGYDEANFAAVLSLVRPDSVCLDVGANIGIYSMVMSRRAAEVHAFEPVGHIRQKLLLNRALNNARNVVVNDFALGSEPGEFPMFQVKEGEFRGGTSSFIRNDNVQEMGDQAFEVGTARVVKLDDYAAKLARLDFIKIDVEGFEYDVLDGGRETIARHRPAVLFEHDQDRLGKIGRAEEQFQRLFEALGYRCFEIVAGEHERAGMTPYRFNRKLSTNNLVALAL